MHSALNPPSAFANDAVRFFPDPNRGIECHPSVDLSGVPHTRDLDVLGQPYATVMRAGEFAVAVGLIPRYLQSLRPGDNVLGIAAYPGSGGIQLSLLDLYEGEALKEAFGGDTGYDALENVSHLVVSTNELVTDDQRRYSHAQGVLDQYGMAYVPITDPLPELDGTPAHLDIFTIEGFIERGSDSLLIARTPGLSIHPAYDSVDIFAAAQLCNNRAELELLENFATLIEPNGPFKTLTSPPLKQIGASYISWFDHKNGTANMPKSDPDFEGLHAQLPELEESKKEMFAAMQREQLLRIQQRYRASD